MRGQEAKESRRLPLLREVYEAVYNEVESFEEENIGADLAYLLGAMLEGSCCDWDADRPFVKLLRGHFPQRHSIWGYVHLERPEGKEEVGHTLSDRELATILAALRFWQRHEKMDADPCNDVASDGGRLQPLCDDEIDRLCERLNIGDALTAAKGPDEPRT